MTRLRLVLLVAGVGACAPRPPAPAPQAPRPSADLALTDSTVVTLERTPCLGACPVYTLTLSGSGLVRFVGQRHTAHLGEATTPIPSQRVDSLVEELREGGYFDFADEYVHGAPGCGRYATDSPSVITSVAAGGERKRIHHDYGCGDAPPALAALEHRIDEVAGSARWTGR